jgi:hypothetical protein
MRILRWIHLGYFSGALFAATLTITSSGCDGGSQQDGVQAPPTSQEQLKQESDARAKAGLEKAGPGK